MAYWPNGYPGRERKRALRLKISHMWRSLLGLSPKQHSSCQDPSQFSNPQTSSHPPEVIPGTEIIIAIMGITGTGKSYLIREVTGNSEVKVSGSPYSCTRKVQPYSFEYAGAKITLVDTPGFDDTERSDMEVLQEIADWASETYRNDRLLSGIIYLHPINHIRMTGSARKNLRVFQSLCGQEALQNVLLTTTQWSKANPVEGQAREDSLRGERFWGGLIDKGATLQRFHGTRDSGFELIHRLMSNIPKPLMIQEQIVNQNMTLFETNAGQCLNEELIAQERIYQAKLESLENELQAIIEATDDETGRALLEERVETQNKLEEAEAGMKLLAELHAAEVKKREVREVARRSDKAVIAVATEDIAITADIAGVTTSYKTRGRLISDFSNHKEFESYTIEITINYKVNFLSRIRAFTKTSRKVFGAGIGDTNYIILNGVYYRCKSGTPISVGSQEFVIFSQG